MKGFLFGRRLMWGGGGRDGWGFGHGRHGHGFGHGGGGRGGRGGFGHGGLRLVLLSLIAEKPAHGYELIKAIEERSGGRYAPSPGVIYPALSWLEDGGFISIAVGEDSRKLASITEAGRTYLAEQADEVERLLAMMGDGGGGRDRGTDFAPLFRAMDNLKGALRTRGMRPLSKGEIENIVDWIDELARKIERS